MTSVDAGSAVTTVHWIRQVHGATVLAVPSAGRDAAPRPAPGHPVPVEPVFAGTGDALVAVSPSVALAVLTADCASVALGSPEGIFAAAHAGWRGLAAGVIAGAVGAMRSRGATEVVGALGPCIHAECYEFAEDDLADVAAVLGTRARGRTRDGNPALDIPAAVSSALASCDAAEVAGLDRCTACAGGYFSHRRRTDFGRQALLVWSGDSRSAGPGLR
jgi:YfiH family protein